MLATSAGTAGGGGLLNPLDEGFGLHFRLVLSFLEQGDARIAGLPSRPIQVSENR